MREEVLDLLAEICEDDVVKEDLETELFESGLLDSLGFAEFLVDLEDHCGIVISPSEVERADIDTPEKILKLVEARSEEMCIRDRSKQRCPVRLFGFRKQSFLFHLFQRICLPFFTHLQLLGAAKQH